MAVERVMVSLPSEGGLGAFLLNQLSVVDKLEFRCRHSVLKRCQDRVLAARARWCRLWLRRYLESAEVAPQETLSGL